LIIGCDSCSTVVDLDLRVKPRDPSIPIALRDVQYPRCNGHGIIALARHPSIYARFGLRQIATGEMVNKTC
jgi:hypothetical protein